MSNTLKVGLDYAGWATDIFDNESSPIDDLLDAQGWVGFGVYFFLCQRAYGTDGYFYRWNFNNAASTARKMGGGVKSDTVKQVVSLCLQKGLFDNRLFDREGILTSRAIQKRYMLAIEKRSKNARTINKDYWLLEKEETKAYIIIPENELSLPENELSLPENELSLPENTTKESKVKYSKAKYSNVDAASGYGQHGHVNLTKQEYDDLCKLYLIATVDKCIEKVDTYLHKHPNVKGYDSHYQTVLDWLEKDGADKKTNHSYDLDLLWKHAMETTPKIR